MQPFSDSSAKVRAVLLIDNHCEKGGWRCICCQHFYRKDYLCRKDCVSLSFVSCGTDVVRNSTFRGDGCMQKALRASLHTSAEVGAGNTPPQELQATHPTAQV